MTVGGGFPIVARLVRPGAWSMSNDSSPLAEFSRPIAADQIGLQETIREIVANATERQRLAERFDLLALDRLTATLRLRRGRGGLIEVDGHFEADVVQACVATLEPVPAQVAADFAVSFAARVPASGGEVVVGVDEEDPPEELVNGRIDMGETVAQQLAIALDPYPRSPTAEGAAGDGEEGAAARTPEGPFAALKGWRGPRED